VRHKGASGIALRGALLFAAGVATPLAAAALVTIGKIRVQLFYELSGTLSRDIAPPAKFDLWNVGAGEGSADEPAEDVLITVPLSLPMGTDMAAFAPELLTISVHNQAGKLLAERRYGKESILVPYTGQSYARLWVNNLQCAGRITITARYGAIVRSTKLNFACGE
jgi:hypothetical protein